MMTCPYLFFLYVFVWHLQVISTSQLLQSCWGSSDCDFSTLWSRNDLEMPYKNMGPTISKHIEKIDTDKSTWSMVSLYHIKQASLPWFVHEISWIKYKMTINPTTTVQIILITRFHFLIDLPRMLFSSKMRRIVLVVIRTKLKSPICHKSPHWATKIKPSNNPIFATTLKHNPQQDTFVSMKSCQC